MEFRKYRLKKKWWQVSSYKVYNEHDELICTTKELGVLNRRIVFYNQDKLAFLTMKSLGIGSVNYNYRVGEKVVGSIVKNWSRNKFTISQYGKGEIVLEISYWNRKIRIHSEGEQIGMGSSNSYYSEIGVAVNTQVEPTLILGALVLIGALKTKGYL